MQGIAGVRSVTAAVFRPLGDTTGPAVRDIILLGRTKVARLDADPDFPEHGTLEVRVVGLDQAGSRARTPIRIWRITGVARHDEGSPQVRIFAVGGVLSDGTPVADERRGGDQGDRARGAASTSSGRPTTRST